VAQVRVLAGEAPPRLPLLPVRHLVVHDEVPELVVL
jgi:hypothetical protein